MKRGLVLGCGGTLGMAWTVATLAELQRSLDWDAREADVTVGTSAGAELACMLGAGVAVDDLLLAQAGDPDAPLWIADHLRDGPKALPPRPSARVGSLALARLSLRGRAATVPGLTGLAPVGRGNAGWLHSLAERMTGGNRWIAHSATRIVAANYDTGERVAFGAPGAPEATMSEALRASWAVPGWLAPVVIGGRRYVDGGICSPASADLLAGAGLDEVIVLAPMASAQPGRPVGLLARVEYRLRRHMTAILDAEVSVLERAGTRVVRLEPDGRDLAAMGANFMDPSRRQATLVSAAASARERLAA